MPTYLLTSQLFGVLGDGAEFGDRYSHDTQRLQRILTGDDAAADVFERRGIK